MISLLMCILSICSDDMLGVLGNERLMWSASESATYYVIAVWTPELTPEFSECASTNDISKDLPGTSCYADRLCVKACKPDPEGGPDLCSNYNILEPVEVLPWACVRTTVCVEMRDNDVRTARCESCEEPCYSGAPKRLLNVPLCP